MKRSLSAAAVSLAVFAILTAMLCAWLSDFASENTRRQKDALESALNRNLLLSYALEGSYPATLQELLEQYPMRYDRERFAIDYRFQGGNILPDITILEIPR